jgi:hypothetical protein
LGRWNKYELSAAILSDWFRLWQRYGQEILTKAASEHKAHIPETKWKPDLSKIQSNAQRHKRQGEPPKAQPQEHYPKPWYEESDEKIMERYNTSNSFMRNAIKKYRPDIVGIIESEPAKKKSEVISQTA